MPFTTLTLHPAIDRVVETNCLTPGGLIDYRLRFEVPAGKGVNTARSLRCMVGEKERIQAAVWLSQSDAAQWKRELARGGIRLSACPRPVPTRRCLTILETATGRETHLKGAMPTPTATEQGDLISFCRSLKLRTHYVAICGSAPPRTSPKTLNLILSSLKKNSARVIADTNGPFLRAAFRSGLAGIKGNAMEIGAQLKCSGPIDPTRPSHRKLLLNATSKANSRSSTGRFKPGMILVTLGAEGAVLAHDDHLWICRPPKVSSKGVRSATGCGDAATAGWMWGISRDIVPKELVRLCVACGTAKLLNEDPGRVNQALVSRLLRRTQAHRIQR